MGVLSINKNCSANPPFTIQPLGFVPTKIFFFNQQQLGISYSTRMGPFNALNHFWGEIQK
jgi:hypothetical protein